MKSRDSFAETAREVHDRAVSALREAPSRGRRSASARVRCAHGFACDVEHEDRALRVDLPASEGGSASGPHPGQLLRASLGACLLMGYRSWAAVLGVPVDAVSVDIACEYDARGQLGVDPCVPVGWTSVHFDVTVVTSATELAVRRLSDTVHRHSPMLANLSADIRRSFDVRVVRPLGGASDIAPTARSVPSDVTPD